MPSLFDVIDASLADALSQDLQTPLSGLCLAVANDSGGSFPGVVLDPKVHPLPDNSGRYQRCGGGRRVIRKPLGNN